MCLGNSTLSENYELFNKENDVGAPWREGFRKKHLVKRTGGMGVGHITLKGQGTREDILLLYSYLK